MLNNNIYTNNILLIDDVNFILNIFFAKCFKIVLKIVCTLEMYSHMLTDWKWCCDIRSANITTERNEFRASFFAVHLIIQYCLYIAQTWARGTGVLGHFMSIYRLDMNVHMPFDEQM